MKIIDRLYQLMIAGACLILFSCMKKELIEKESEKALEDIKVTINGAIGWAKNKDFNLLNSIIANDSNYLEVDPGPGLIKGFSQFKRNDSIWRSPDFKALKYEIRDLTINLAEKGDVAWFYCVLDDINEWKGKPASWMNTRWTGVLEKRGKSWIMVQMHFSFAKNQ
jgi:hypothetical protein